MKQSLESNYVWAAILIVAGSILFSTKAVIIKLAYNYEIDSLSLLALRMLFSLPFFIGTLIFATKKGNQSTIKSSDWWKMAGIGILGFYGASYLDFLGLQYISASLERMILYVYPTLVLLISAILFRKKITSIQVLALVLTYIGIAIIFSGKLSTVGNTNPVLGGVFVFFAALTYASYLVGSGQLLPRIGTRRFTAYSMIAATIVVLGHYLLSSNFKLFDFPKEIYGLVFFMAIFATVIPTFMISEGIRIMGANNAAILGAIGPVSTIILAHIFLGERLYPIQYIGTLVVIFGVLIITLNKNAKQTKKKKMIISR